MSAGISIALSREDILHYANLYKPDGDDVLADQLSGAAARGYITLDELGALAVWKWRGTRTRNLCRLNTEEEVKDITLASFAAKSERLRVGALLALHGVGWPMASVILHFVFPTQYPILDVRAMKTIGGSKEYGFARWQEYVRICREAADKHDVSLRMLDKALWSFDKHAVDTLKV